jgi:hypothetical protein
VPDGNDDPSAVIIGCSIDVDVADASAVVTVAAFAVDATVFVELIDTAAAERSDVLATDAVCDAWNRGKEGRAKEGRTKEGRTKERRLRTLRRGSLWPPTRRSQLSLESLVRH